MRFLQLFFLVFVFFTCSEKPQSELQMFNSFMGKEKAIVLDNLVDSFDEFIQLNFSDSLEEGEKISIFLQNLSVKFRPDSNWTFNTEKNRLILDDYENSGLRREITRYGYEEYEPEYYVFYENDSGNDIGKFSLFFNDTTFNDIPDSSYYLEMPPVDFGDEDSIIVLKRLDSLQKIDDSVGYFYMHGKYLGGLVKIDSKDKRILEYIDVKYFSGDISEYVIIDAFRNIFSPKDFENPIIKRMVVVELYFYLIQMDIENKNKLTN